MCKAISGITKSDGTIFMPHKNIWNHSHTAIAQANGIPDGMLGDTYTRWELTPKKGDYRSDQKDWVFTLDEERMPGWWKDDAVALEDSARRSAQRWFDSVPDNLVPGYKVTAGSGSTPTAGDHSTLTAGHGSTLTAGSGSTLTAGHGSALTAGNGSTLTAGSGSTLTAGDHSTLTAGDHSTLTAGDHSTLTAGGFTLTAGNGSALTAGDGSALTAGDGSTLAWCIWDSTHRRMYVFYVGEGGIKAYTKYRLDKDNKPVEVIESPAPQQENRRD